jgi:helicase
MTEQVEQLSQDLAKLGYAGLNPMQAEAVRAGVLQAPRSLVSAPTASGKTLLALLALVENHRRTRQKAAYVVPLRALASEKHKEFSRVLEPFGIRVAVSTGDYDDAGDQLGGYDLVIVTSEKMDSLLRHNAAWAKEVGFAVIDEVHLLGDDERGATLEIVLTKLLQQNARLLCLSATVPNADQIAAWLGAKLFTSTWRPTKLTLALAPGPKLVYIDGRSETLGEKRVLEDLLGKALAAAEGNGQALVFVASRRGAEATARELAPLVAARLKPAEVEKLAEASARALKALPNPTHQCRLLAECLRQGIAFHHAGLEGRQREVIELGFKQERALKVIVATTTLAMGIDYPASWVVVKDLKRFTGSFSQWIPALEVHQMVGRAGRPRYDKEGVGVLVCNPRDAAEVRERFVFGPLEEIWSQLASEPVLRVHALGLVASGHARTPEELYAFFERTLHAHQYGSLEALLAKVERVVGELKEMDFVRERAASLVATPVGKRVSELYLDPLTAWGYLQFLRRQVRAHLEPGPFDELLALCAASEMRPYVTVKQGEQKRLWEEMYEVASDEAWSEELERGHEDALGKYKTAKLLNAWMNETTEEELLTTMDVPPGIVHARVRIAEWLAYGLAELAFLENQPLLRKSAAILRRRLKHGIKEELLSLCRIRGIGRVRARKLHAAGIKTLEEYRATPKEELRRILRVEAPDAPEEKLGTTSPQTKAS